MREQFEADGEWITINGRHVLISNGPKTLEHLETALISGHDSNGGKAAVLIAAGRFGGKEVGDQGNALLLDDIEKQQLKKDYDSAFTELYNKSQAELIKREPSGQITLYRGIKNKDAALSSQVNIGNNALTSWSSDLEVSKQFSKTFGARGAKTGHGIVLAAKVPTTAILVSHLSSPAMNQRNEKEFVVLSGKLSLKGTVVSRY